VPELPDITLYLEALGDRIVGQQLKGVTLIHPFLLRTATPPLATVAGRRVERLRRVGKRIAIGLAGQLWLVLHLMIAGRLHWYASGQKVSGRSALARFEFDSGTLTLTEAGSKRRASLYLLAGDAELERGVCLVGPHRDDLELLLGDHVAKGFASHGESWSMALALRLAAYELLRADGGDPVLLLDDVFAELDTARRQALANVAADAEQVLVTAAVHDDVPSDWDARRIEITMRDEDAGRVSMVSP